MAPPKLKGLGRGLDVLLSGNQEDAPMQPSGSLQTLPVSQLQPGKYQPRTRMDPGSLEELAASIRAQGVMQPILVRPVGEARYEIIAGERRWRASQIAGLMDVPVLVREIPDESALAMSLIENIQRENLNPLEEAAGLQRLVDEFSMTHQQAAEAVGRSRSAASNLLRLLQLTKPVQELLMAGDIDMGHARALLPLSGAQQVAAANRVVAKRLSVRDTEALVQSELNPREADKTKKGAARNAVAGGAVDRDLTGLEEEISDALCARVMIQTTPRGAGQVIIDYSSLDQLDGILDRLRGKVSAMAV
jgi:ParB family chromosome partitioning protein